MLHNEEDVKDLENLSNMVEKIRESHQRHARNISSVSEISTTGSSSDPLKPDENAEIRVVILCDSEIEKKCVREAFNSLICDDQSNIKDAKYSRHRWDSNEECTGMPSCFFCIREPETMTFRHQNSDSGLRSVSTAPSNFGDGFFRFTMDDTVYRVMLLSKDKQNLLKIIHYNFLVVGMQVKDSFGSFDEEIWKIEFEKRLERFSKKAIAPIILMGYCRDISKLGPIKRGPQKDKIIEECKNKIKKIGKKRKAIPRFVDFVEGTSEQLCVIFGDIERLFKHPGYRLQQCAYVNNALHFGSIIENPDVTMADLCYPEEGTKDSPIMIAAKLRHKDVLNAFLRSNKFDYETCDTGLLDQVIHYRNELGQSLLHAVALQGPELEEQKLQILRKEINLHIDLSRDMEQFHVTEQIKLQRCLRGQLKSSAEAAIILDQSRALQGIPKTEHELKMEKGKVWSRLFFASLLLMLIFNAIDTGSDILIVIRYYYEMYPENDNRRTMPCGEIETGEKQIINCDKTENVTDISIQCIPQDLTGENKFAYTLLFLLVPWPFFTYEFFTSRQYEQLVEKGKEIVAEIAKCSGFKDVMSWYLKAIGYAIFFLCCLIFWPIAVLFIKYYNDGKYYLAKGEQRSAREKKIESSEVLWQTARVMEVSLESSFQPTIQLYIIFPVLVKNLTNTTFNFNVFTICKYDDLNFPIIKADQTISIVTSILSLAWCFTSYHATLKRGALDKDLAALFYRAVLFLSVLFQILGRLFIFVIFSYSFGSGNYHPLLYFLLAHTFLMSVLHFIFSDAKVYWQKGGKLNLSFFHYMLGNGLANIYIHNWIRMDPFLVQGQRPLQHVSTLVRQLIMDLVFVAENVTLLFIGLNSEITEIKEYKITFAIVLLGFSFVGLILKCVYYRYLHIWAWLIMDYTIKIEDGHWKCSLLSDMYLCGNLKERNLTLFYIPATIYKFLKYCCGDDSLKCGEHHCSRCSAIITVFLVPIAIVTGLIALTLLLVVTLLFLPIFIVFILPCVVVAKCRNIKTRPIKEYMDEGVPLKDVSAGSTTVNGDVVHAENGEDDGPNGDVINHTEDVIEEQPRAAHALQEQV